MLRGPSTFVILFFWEYKNSSQLWIEYKQPFLSINQKAKMQHTYLQVKKLPIQIYFLSLSNCTQLYVVIPLVNILWELNLSLDWDSGKSNLENITREKSFVSQKTRFGRNFLYYGGKDTERNKLSLFGRISRKATLCRKTRIWGAETYSSEEA